MRALCIGAKIFRLCSFGINSSPARCLTGTAEVPCMGHFFVNRLSLRLLIYLLFDLERPVSSSRPTGRVSPSRAGAVKDGALAPPAKSLTAPSTKADWLWSLRTKCHKAIRSLRAKATIIFLRKRGAFSVRARNQLAQGALLLEIEETPRELDHAFAHSSIARSGKHSRGVSCRSRRASLHSEPRRAGRASCVTAPP
jgi:hypothetical protein